ncbi:MAG: hypothetical protein JKY54_00630 [Flavobacteriales bacterium]|nr:hypothetical protein [Flavobacteriales bacterium]
MKRCIAFVLLVFLTTSSVWSQEDSVVKPGPKWKKLLPTGNLSFGYDYGLLPFLGNVNPPQGNFKTQGNTSLELFGLPLNANYYYSSLANVSG